jgi:chloramphenicol-sensitive protein RarD
LIRKNLNLHSVAGLAVETIIASPVALIGLWWLYDSGEMKFGAVDMNTNLLLVMGGLVTSFPLLCFAAAVTRLSLTVIGMFQYLAPSISLIIAVTIYHEPFGLDRLVTFACIWCALIIFTTEATLHHRRVYRKR